MKKLLFLAISGMVLISCNQKNESKSTEVEKQAKVETQNFDWLLGEWKRINEEKGKQTYERWKKNNNSEYIGIGFTLKNRDTLSKEDMKLVKNNGKWNLLVKTREEKESVTFNMAEITKDKFVCVNDSIDFPKRIEYYKNGNKINAIISGGDLIIPFDFERLK